MTLQLTQTKTFYKPEKDWFYWMYDEESGELLQFCEGFANYWKPGTELYGCKVRELKKLKQIPLSEGEQVLKEHIERLTATLEK